uniref:Reverse transcriptase Ty1/copia-type domain-containing protein n=1 Tax=Chromera velia CCMP2878 TaxID=1169474 RepID=A0A0G4GPW1_9ALVE|eukprot:Cvel_22864.t1-p1 / transcript=Cvel_22864.t1 / gene=Cvel_22864 / organism=Chromera_velia_CCMP2878 / gene_product=hypothetical protein / transcript_product=hypothetical protein / location=Cvel_scaffold2295:7748-9412(-) / protein_length=403 / sequence_SO=supercontig / SO=protein_coding / is_pseudo=false
MFRSGVSLRPATRGEIESGRFEKSRLDKFCGLLENGVFGERVTRQKVVAVTNMGEYTGVKKKPGGEEKEKDRMVIKGGADPWVYDTYAGVLAQQSLLTCLPYMIIRGKVIYSVDVVKAFQQIEDRHKHSLGVLGVRIPAGLPELPVENPFPKKYDNDQWLGLRKKAAMLISGAIHRLEKAYYGGRHAGNLFVFSLQFELQKDDEYTLVEEAVLQFTRNPTRRHLRNVGLIIFRMQQEKERIEIRPLLPEGRAVHFYSDASRKPKMKEVRKGTVRFWGDKTWSHEKGDEWNPVLFKTTRSTKLHDHPYSAEMEALKQTVREAWRPCYFIDELTGKFLRVRFYLDSKGIYNSLRSGKCTAKPELQKELDYMIQGMRRMGVDMLRDVMWIPRELNRADWLTKPIWW